jgi:hypothetical protein
LRNEFITYLKKDRSYELTVKENLDYVLGIALRRDRAARMIYLNLDRYIQDTCDKHSSLLNSTLMRNFDVPAMHDMCEYSQEDCPKEGSPEWLEMQAYRAVYFTLIGVLIWVTSTVHVHLCVPVAILSRFSINPSRKHLNALIRVYLFLKKYSSLELALGGTGPGAESISIYTDSSHEEGPSLSGVLIVMGTAVVNWFSRRQKFSQRNSTAAEAMANADGCDEGIYMRELAKDFGVDVQPSPFWSDNESSVRLHNDYYSCKKSKHIARAINTLRQYCLTRVYQMSHIYGFCNYADILTKPLGADLFWKFATPILNALVVPGPSSGTGPGGGVTTRKKPS